MSSFVSKLTSFLLTLMWSFVLTSHMRWSLITVYASFWSWASVSVVSIDNCFFEIFSVKELNWQHLTDFRIQWGFSKAFIKRTRTVTFEWSHKSEVIDRKSLLAFCRNINTIAFLAFTWLSEYALWQALWTIHLLDSCSIVLLKKMLIIIRASSKIGCRWFTTNYNLFTLDRLIILSLWNSLNDILS